MLSLSWNVRGKSVRQTYEKKICLSHPNGRAREDGIVALHNHLDCVCEDGTLHHMFVCTISSSQIRNMVFLYLYGQNAAGTFANRMARIDEYSGASLSRCLQILGNWTLPCQAQGKLWRNEDFHNKTYFLCSIKHVANMDVSSTKMCLDTSLLTTCFRKRREYCRCASFWRWITDKDVKLMLSECTEPICQCHGFCFC
jgi:hypothetical protein